MSVLSVYFDSSVNQCSPVQKDYRRVVNFDKEGNEHITYVEEDYPSIIKSNGTIENWSLKSLLSAGIDPSFSIRTGIPTRIEGVGVVESLAPVVDSILSDTSKSE